jgi:hypothetical protein
MKDDFYLKTDILDSEKKFAFAGRVFQVLCGLRENDCTITH